MKISFEIIEEINKELEYGSNSITNIIRNKYPSLSRYIYDITNAYFQYKYRKVIEKDIDHNIYEILNNYIVDNNYHKDSIITIKVYDNIINFIKLNGYDKYTLILNDIIFLVYKDYNLIPIYDHNIVYIKHKY